MGTTVQTRDIPDYAVYICLDDRAGLVGTLHSPLLAEPEVFAGDVELICRMQECYNRIGRPQSTTILRKFVGTVPEYTSFNRHPVKVREAGEIRSRKGREISLELLMLSRKHAEWQGLILDEMGQALGRFATMRECLELLRGVQQ